VKQWFPAHIEIHGHPYIRLVVNQSFVPANKWGQNQLEDIQENL
jgi:hypothetical protein